MKTQNPLSRFLTETILSAMNLREKQRLLKIERFAILSRYQASNAEELNQKIIEGSAPEHPGWEDLIEMKNIEQEINEIENDIKVL